LRKDDIRQFLNTDETKFFGCFKENTQYMDPSRMYIKVPLFHGAPSFLTMDNIQTMLNLDYVYWLEQEHPFLQLPFLANAKYLTNQGIEIGTFHYQEGTGISYGITWQTTCNHTHLTPILTLHFFLHSTS